MAHAAEQRLELIKEEGTAKSPADTAASEVSDEVREIAAELLRKRKAGPKGAPLKLRTDESGTLHIGYRHSNEALGGTLLMADIGSASIAFFSGLMAQISVLGSHGKRVDEMNSNFVLSVVASAVSTEQAAGLPVGAPTRTTDTGVGREPLSRCAALRPNSSAKHGHYATISSPRLLRHGNTAGEKSDGGTDEAGNQRKSRRGGSGRSRTRCAPRS
jgi:hypothetical protein